MEKLQVPENITLRREVWRGVGKRELAAILAVTFFALIVSVMFCGLSSSEADKLIAIFIVVTATAVACGIFTKMDNNQSIYDYFCRQIRFKRDQQNFQWRRKGEKEGVYLVTKEETA